MTMDFQKTISAILAARTTVVATLDNGHCAYHVCGRIYSLWRDGVKLETGTPEALARRIVSAKEVAP